MQFELSLVKAGLVSADDFVEAITRRDQERPPLGQIAIEEGALSARAVLEVLRAQDSPPRRRFGEVAVDKGLLDPSQVATLLMRQQERQRPLIDHLVELGRLSAEEAAAARQTLADGVTALASHPRSTCDAQETASIAS